MRRQYLERSNMKKQKPDPKQFIAQIQRSNYDKVIKKLGENHE